MHKNKLYVRIQKGELNNVYYLNFILLLTTTSKTKYAGASMRKSMYNTCSSHSHIHVMVCEASGVAGLLKPTKIINTYAYVLPGTDNKKFLTFNTASEPTFLQCTINSRVVLQLSNEQACLMPNMYYHNYLVIALSRLYAKRLVHWWYCVLKCSFSL